MDDLILMTKRYLEDTLDLRAEIRPLDLSAQLPYFYSEYYRFYDLDLNGVNYLLCEGRDILVAKQVRTQLSELENRLGIPAIYLISWMNLNLRRSLVENRVSFIVPKNQIYLPKLGIVFNERYRNLVRIQDSLSPVAQVILIRAILYKEYNEVTASDYAIRSTYSVMSISRAFNELMAYELVDRNEQWKEKRYSWLYQGKDLWDKAQPFLINPVRRSVWINNYDELPYSLAGISALSRYSMINDDDFITYATTSAIANNDLGSLITRRSERSADNATELQIWKYDPMLIIQDGYVDRFSLYLSMRDSTDERIQIALEEMMAGVRW
jgi:hypothetical protein